MAVETLNFTADQLVFAGKVGVLMKGTSDDDSPIPGYLYKEISDISYQSPAHCEFLLEFLVKRMGKKSCHVKYKTLKLAKHLVENGDPAFRTALRQNSQSIQEATKFGGPPDPVHGNLPFLVVRKLAKELCQVVFDVDQEPGSQSTQSHSPAQTQTIVGIGPSEGSRGGKYQGFGNTPTAKKSLGHTIQDGLEKLAEQFSETSAQRQAALLAQFEDSAGDYVPPVVAPVSPPYQPELCTHKQKDVAVSPKKVVAKHVPGRAGGGWEDDLDAPQGQVSGTQSEGSSEQSDRLEAVSAPDWSAEEQIVTENLQLSDRSQFFLLRPSNLKVFKKRCQGLNSEKIVEFINNRMQSADDYVVVRAMLLLETFLVRSDTVSLDFIVTTCHQQLNKLVHKGTDQRIKDKAIKTIRGLECYSSVPDILALISAES
ncbi:AP-4 complex accessory subunit Tepsin-like [Littorina saxatilis]|uniref:ENTH domain-containing protein n=1 Tax=Littorina saxatilis TaxID=31220 RepID=A0AAN9BXX7_9CAEN